MRWKCVVAYEGTNFEGWQSQASGKSVQDFIERRLSHLMGSAVRIMGSGRTDSGVHAEGQVFSFDADWPHGPEKLLRALRTGYPASIQVMSAEVVADDFNARFSAVGKRYRYQYFEGYSSPFERRYYWSLGRFRLDVDQMNEAAQLLVGKHDFSAFSANTGDDREDNPVKDLRELRVWREGAKIYLTTEACGYMYKMVRSLAGCLRDVGIGKITTDEVAQILESRERTHRIQTAPAEGLFLEAVYY